MTGRTDESTVLAARDTPPLVPFAGIEVLAVMYQMAGRCCMAPIQNSADNAIGVYECCPEIILFAGSFTSAGQAGDGGSKNTVDGFCCSYRIGIDAVLGTPFNDA